MGQWKRDKAFGRLGGRLAGWSAPADRFYVGQIVRAVPGAAFAQAGQAVTILELCTGIDVRVAYGDVTDLRVPAHLLEPVEPTARATDPHTSRQAAAMQTPVKLYKAHRQILSLLAEAGDRGLTDFEIADRTGKKQTSFGVRRGELVKAHLVGYAEQDRPSDTGAMAKAWKITDLGLQVWREQILAEAAS